MNSAKTICDRFEERDTAVEYVAGRLSAQDAETYESHYFGCVRCFPALQSAQAANAALASANVVAFPPRPRSRMPLLWLAIAASFAVTAVGLWSYHLTSSAPIPAPAPTITKTTVAEPSLQLLARFEPPKYESQAMRGINPARAAAFRKAMLPYSASDYVAAANSLRIFLAAYPDYTPARFYSASSELLSHDSDRAIADFHAVLASGKSAFSEEAHWGIANAALLKNNPVLARTHLLQVADSKGTFAPQATALLGQLK